MSEEVVKPIAEGSKNTVAKKPMSDADFLAARVAKQKPKPVEPEQKPKPEPEPEKAEAKAEATSPEGAKDEAKPSKAVLSKDVDDLTDEEIAELAEKGKSGLLRRVAELTAKRKLAEEKLAQAEAAMRQQQTATIPAPKVENNPFANVSKPEELAEKDKTYRDIVKWAERVLDEAEGASPDEVVTNEGGSQYTKRQLKQVLRNAREARDEYIPARLRELQEEQQRVQVDNALTAKAREELKWLDDGDNDVKKRYEVMTSNPVFEKITKAVPEAAPHIKYLFAHAANSIYGRREIGIETTPRKAQSTTLTPPSTPNSNAAAPERKETRDEGSLRELESRWKTSRKADDFVALRAQKIAKRQPLKLA
jgi:hypothetical protein